MPHPTLKNALSTAASPYLLQHKDNPVHWQVWGDAALKEAERSGKPILLSVGYAACHWCHVMAHESFEDPDTAAEMNELFVNIKVDREERSDIDQIYMAALHAMGEQGGWPLTMFLNSSGEPFWGGTYFPKTAAYGRPDFVTVLRTIAGIYRSEPDKIARNVTAVKGHLDKTLAAEGTPEQPMPDILSRQARGILSIIDQRHGGIGQAPKFPNASMMETLIRHWRSSASDDARLAALAWLRAMINGGIYDHLGGGLSRYSVDAQWLVPHFEKMLYDNAQLIRSLCWAFGETGDDVFRRRTEETIDWLCREMLLPGGGFASSLDADSEGEEGRFYIWDKAEIDALLGQDASVFCQFYDVTPEGNWEGKTILNRSATPPGDESDLEQRLDRSRALLLAERDKRIRPERDDKVLADWNGMLIRTLVEAGQRFERPDWIDLAQNAFDFICDAMSDNGRLAHAWRNGVTTYPALGSDYGAMIDAALALYEATLDRRILDQARSWTEILDHHYGDGHDGYFYTADDSTDVLLRTRHEHDDASPSANAQILEALAKLALLDSDPVLTVRTTKMAAALWGRIKSIPMAASGAVNAIDTVLQPKKLVLTRPSAEMLAVVRANPDPSRIDLILDDVAAAGTFLPDETSAASLDLNTENKGAAFLCHGPSCLPPIFDAETLRSAIEPKAG